MMITPLIYQRCVLQVHSQLHTGSLSDSHSGPDHFGVGPQAAQIAEISVCAVVDFNAYLSLRKGCREHLGEVQTKQCWGKYTTLLHFV